MDITILLRSLKNDAGFYLSALQALGIPGLLRRRAEHTRHAGAGHFHFSAAAAGQSASGYPADCPP
jgi:hypothetical protein